jgi:hypothetical protein
MPLTFITDIHGNEPDLLATSKNLPLEIRELCGAVIATVQPPAAGWTHESLISVSAGYDEAVSKGADAYLGETWVASTEV